MVIASASGISKSFGINTILEQVSFHINKGDRIGIIGDNGAGKSTLLSIIARPLSHDAGELFISSQADLGYLKQNDNFSSENTVYQEMLSIFSEVIAMEEAMHRLSALISHKSSERADIKELLLEYDALMEAFERKGGFSYQSEIRGILSSMAFPEEYFEKKISTLSGGERTRLALASLLLKKPGVLLLDEPTNHLDISAKEVFEDALLDFPGTVLIVSHDRYLLNKIPTRILEMTGEGIESYLGGYDYYIEKKQSISSGRSYLEDLGKITAVDGNQANGSGASAQSSKEARIEARKKAKEEEAKKRRRQRELAEIEARITSLEEEIRRLEEEMCTEKVYSDHQLSASYSLKLEEAKVDLDAAYEQWAELHESFPK